MDRLDACLRLALTDRVGPLRTAALLERLGAPEAVFQARAGQLCSLADGLGQATARQLLSEATARASEEERAWADAHGVRLLTRYDAAYPALLREIPDPPVLLWVRGDASTLSSVSVAIVGSRRASVYGRGRARALGAGLAAVGVNVVSGAAYGIDQEAHTGALSAGGQTTAVLGCGVGLCPDHLEPEFLDRIAASGAVVSEFPSRMESRKGFFPRRNRIISGLSLGVVVVEAAVRSGALITVRYAGEQGRSVFAVPGPVDSPTSQGTNALIKDGATLVSRASEVLAELAHQVDLAPGGFAAPADGAAGAGAELPFAQAPPPGLPLTEQERTVYAALEPSAELHPDQLCRGTGLPSPAVSTVLLTLELKGLVKRGWGGRYRRA